VLWEQNFWNLRKDQEINNKDIFTKMKKTMKPILILMLGSFLGISVNKVFNHPTVVTYISSPIINLSDASRITQKTDSLAVIIASQELLNKVENKLQIPGLAKRLSPRGFGGGGGLEIIAPRGSDYVKISLSADSYGKAVLITKAIVEQIDIQSKAQVLEANNRMRKLLSVYESNSDSESRFIDDKQPIVSELILQRKDAKIVNAAERIYRLESLIEENNLQGRVQVISGPNYIFTSNWEFILKIFYVTLLLFCVFYWSELRIFLLRQKSN
jgi:hypothetical protein